MNKLNLADFRARFCQDLKKYFESNLLLQKDCISENFNINSNFISDELLKYMLSFIEKGKMFRPYLVYVMAKNKTYKECLNYCLAIELLHFFALIHDDVMDKAESRRLNATLHEYFKSQVSNLNIEKTKLDHIANSMAVLAGDYVFSICEGAFEDTENESNYRNHRLARKCFQQLKSEVILGQILDVELELMQNPSKDLILQKTYLKTANYSISRPMQIGVTISERSELTDFCLEFGFNLGLAFQLQDDLLSLTQEKEITGKEIFSDIVENKHTLATWFIRNNLGSELINYFESNFVSNKNLDKDDLASFLKKNKVIEYLQKNIDEYYSLALEIAVSKEENELIELVKELSKRKK